MTDIAQLGLAIDTSQLGQANAALDQLTQKATAAEQATGKLAQSASTQMAGIAQVTKAASGETVSWSDQHQKALQGLNDRLDPIGAKMRALANDNKLVSDAMAAGKISIADYGTMLEKLNTTHAVATKGLGEFRNAHREAGAAMFQNRMMMMELEHSGRSMIDVWMSGGSALRGMMMELPRLAEVAAMSGGSLGGTVMGAVRGQVSRLGGLAMSAATNPYVLGAAAVGGIGYETYSLWGREEARRTMDASTGAAIQASGGISGASTGDYQRLAAELAKYSHLSSGEAIKIATEVARMPQINASLFPQFARTAENFGLTTGVPATKAAEQLAEALKDPAKGMETLAQKGIVLSAAQQQVIERLEAEGRLEEARALVLKDVGEKVAGAFDRLPQVTKNAEEAAHAWDHFQDALSKSTFIKDIADGIDNLSKHAANFLTSTLKGIDSAYKSGDLATGLIAGADGAPPIMWGSGGVNAGPSGLRSGGALRSVARAAAAQYGVPEDMFLHQIAGESGFNPAARSSAGALGVAQFLPSTAARYGVNPLDPVQSLYGAAHYMSDLHRQRGSWTGAMRGYLGARTDGQLAHAIGGNREYEAAYGYAAANSGLQRLGPADTPSSAAGNAHDLNSFADRLDPIEERRKSAQDLAERIANAVKAAEQDLRQHPGDQSYQDRVNQGRRELGSAQWLAQHVRGPGDTETERLQFERGLPSNLSPAERQIREATFAAQQRAISEPDASQRAQILAAGPGLAQAQQRLAGGEAMTQAQRQLQQATLLGGAQAGGPSAIRDAEAKVAALNEQWRTGAINVKEYAAAIRAISEAGADKQIGAITYALKQQADAEERLAIAAKGGVTAINDQKIANEAIARAGAVYSPIDPRFDPTRRAVQGQLQRADDARAAYTFNSDLSGIQRANRVAANNNDVLRTGTYADYQVQQALSQYREKYRQQTGNDITSGQADQYKAETAAAIKLRDANQQLLESHQALASAITGVADSISSAVKTLADGMGHSHALRNAGRSLAGSLGSIATKTFVTDPLQSGLKAMSQGKSFTDALSGSYSGIASGISSLFGGGASGGGGLVSGATAGGMTDWANAATGDFGGVALASGGLVDRGRVTRYAASGFVATDPMSFRGANNNLTIGEQGSEAVMPLRTLPNGRLGVESAGGGGNVTVIQNVHTSDGAGFRRSQAQITADMTAQFNRAAKRR